MKGKTYGNSRFRQFFRHNGVFLALAVSLFAVVSVIIAGMGERLTSTSEESQLPSEEQVE